jgi:zinc transporter 1/2/3
MTRRAFAWVILALAALHGAVGQTNNSNTTNNSSNNNNNNNGGSVVDCGSSSGASYNMQLAIASVFVLFAISFVGASFPALLALRRHPYLVLSIKFGSFAGTGVLLATGFVHMLASAQENLSSPCLSATWLGLYPAWAFLFTVITIVILQVVDFYLSLLFQPPSTDAGELDVTTTSPPSSRAASSSPPSVSAADPDPASTSAVQLHPMPRQAADEEEGVASDVDEACNKHAVCKDEDCNGRRLLWRVPTIHNDPKALSNLFLSEASVAVHSVIIGLALGVTPSSQFTALFVALIFHQLLEGIALGSTASEAGVTTRGILTLGLFYACTTPLGIAIGIGVRNSLNSNSPPMLLVTGILESISAGTLIFLSLGDHMNAPKSQAAWLRTQSHGIRILCFGFFFAGAAAMLVIAIWA